MVTGTAAGVRAWRSSHMRIRLAVNSVISGSVIWSKLSKNVKNAEPIYRFKKKIRKVDLEQAITDGCNNCLLCCT